MPTSPLTRATTAEIPAIHAAIAAPGALQSQRRALYQFAVELLAPGIAPVPGPEVVDSPLARRHIGDALAGRTSLASDELVDISTLSRADCSVAAIPVASRPEANTLLTGALKTVSAELNRQRAMDGTARVLTEEDGRRFTSAHEVLRDGMSLARQVSPELLDDLLGHVSLIGIIDPRLAGRLASASPRNFPGLVLLEALTKEAVAEALVHEGAHQKLFDLAITHDLLNASSDECMPFRPPWRPDSRWPLEQALAAAHAYCCLARFERDAVASGLVHPPVRDSLLPFARIRSEMLGEWLLTRGRRLGADAHKLLEGLLGQRPSGALAAERSRAAAVTDYVVDTELKVRQCGNSDRALVGRASQPPELFWVSNDAAQFLEHAQHKTADQVVDVFAQRWQLSHSDAADRLGTLLSDLHKTGLVTLKGHPEPVTGQR